MPGTDYRDTADAVLGELADLPFVPELPGRGVHAAMVGRTVGLLGDLGVDLQPAGWRLTDAPGIDQRRATSLLAHDLDIIEEQGQGLAKPLKLQVVGPWTLAALMERPRGDKVLADHGARRDLAQALAEGLRAHAADLRRRVPKAGLVVQLDEPALPAVLGGGIPTASGFSRHRSVQPPDAAQALDWVLAPMAAEGHPTVLHCCAADVPITMLSKTVVQALSFDVALLGRAAADELGEWVDSGRALWLGVVPTTEPEHGPATDNELTTRVLRWWADLGYSDIEHVPDTVVTPTCGLAGASPSWARRALAQATTVARNLSVEAGKIEP